ncbi:MAG TPA: carboxypeptidase-like regulatory domain-containing protein [Candidatus Acidoferrales bacterium]|nr:carboxypeptidase-like regulatory domain-containing protein [Candidatus Acidoferrales bacterium]
MNSRIFGAVILILGLFTGLASRAAAESPTGKIAGVVLDPSGVPQMGATVVVTAQSVTSASVQLLTNAHGRFAAAALLPGVYSVRVTLAGFLPSLQPNVSVNSSRTTSLQIELGSIFTGLNDLHRRPSEKPDDAEWGWVLRSAASTRPILRWQDGHLVVTTAQESRTESSSARQPRSRIDFTSGMRPGAATSFSESPATAFAYDQAIGATGQLLFAGQVSYENETPSGGFATLWLPEGNGKSGPSTSLVVRQSRLGANGPVFRGMRLDQNGILTLGDAVTLRYGAEYLLTSLGNEATAGLRPRAELAVRISPDWQASLLLASRPWPEASPEATAPLESALDSLDAFPTMLFRDGRPVLEDGWHEELAVERLFAHHNRVILAGFHDRSNDTAVFGRGSVVDNANFLQDFFTDGFAYDAGVSDSWGARAAYQQKFSKDISTTVVYAWAGALAPSASSAANGNLRDALSTQYRHSIAGSVTSRIPVLGTELTTGYKWIDGMVVSRQDEYGEAFFRLDPYFNLMVHQPIPCLHRMQAMADFGNLLAQGYVPMTTRDGRVVMVAAYRTFRGGISVQF